MARTICGVAAAGSLNRATSACSSCAMALNDYPL
jgi:hypothetical protein